MIAFDSLNIIHHDIQYDFNSCWSFDSQPPIVPEVSHDGDTKNFDDYPNDDWQKATAVSEEQLKHFKDFWIYKMYILAYFVDEPLQKYLLIGQTEECRIYQVSLLIGQKEECRIYRANQRHC